MYLLSFVLATTAEFDLGFEMLKSVGVAGEFHIKEDNSYTFKHYPKLHWSSSPGSTILSEVCSLSSKQTSSYPCEAFTCYGSVHSPTHF